MPKNTGHEEFDKWWQQWIAMTEHRHVVVQSSLSEKKTSVDVECDVYGDHSDPAAEPGDLDDRFAGASVREPTSR